MFRQTLGESLGRIFGFKKVSFNDPSESFEQDVLFVQVANCLPRFHSGKVFARGEGRCFCFSQDSKMPFGYFAKRIENASAELKKDFFFSSIDENNNASPARELNKFETGVSFVFFFCAQYNPNRGELTSVEFSP